MKPTRNTLLLLAIAMIASSCSAAEPGEPADPQREALQEARQRWSDEQIASYEYRVTQICFCMLEFVRPYQVRVEAGRVVEARDSETGAPPPETYETRTVEDLFAVVEDALERDAFSLEVEYHPELGYPTSIQIDYDQMAADEELGLRAEELRPLP